MSFELRSDVRTMLSQLLRPVLRTALVVALAAPITEALAQSPGSSALSRLGGLEIERSPGTIDTELAQRHARRGNTYNNLERYDEAIEEYRLSIAADPNHVDSLRNLANIYYFQERYNEAIPLLARFIRLQQDTRTAALIAAQKTLGQLLRDQQRWDDAIDIDLLAIEVEPQNDSQVYVMGNTYFNAGRTDLAIRIYERAIAVMRPNAFLHRTLGRMLEMENRLDDALQQYRAASEVDPDSQFYKDLISGLEARLSR